MSAKGGDRGGNQGIGTPSRPRSPLNLSVGVCAYAHILHCLLPAHRDDGLTGRWRSRNKYPTVRARNNHFKSSVLPCALANCQ